MKISDFMLFNQYILQRLQYIALVGSKKRIILINDKLKIRLDRLAKQSKIGSKLKNCLVLAFNLNDRDSRL